MTTPGAQQPTPPPFPPPVPDLALWYRQPARGWLDDPHVVTLQLAKGRTYRIAF